MLRVMSRGQGTVGSAGRILLCFLGKCNPSVRSFEYEDCNEEKIEY